MLDKQHCARHSISYIDSNERRNQWKEWKTLGKYLEKNFHIFPEGFCSFKALNNIVEMHKELILAAFEKAMTVEREMGILSPSKSKAAELLSEYIENELNFQFGERRLRDYYNAAINEEHIELKQEAVRKGLARYLGYQDYTDFVLKNSDAVKKDENSPRSAKSESQASFNLIHFLKGNRTTIGIIVGCYILFLGVNYLSQQRWMIWKNDHYEEIDFDAEKQDSGQLLVLNKITINRFKKIKPDCEFIFFNPDGKPKIWYGKNKNGELEFFSDFDKHPETGKTLKPITQYMIDKYICK